MQVGNRVSIVSGDAHDRGRGGTITQVMGDGWVRVKVDGRGLEGAFRETEVKVLRW